MADIQSCPNNRTNLKLLLKTSRNPPVVLGPPSAGHWANPWAKGLSNQTTLKYLSLGRRRKKILTSRREHFHFKGKLLHYSLIKMSGLLSIQLAFQSHPNFEVLSNFIKVFHNNQFLGKSNLVGRSPVRFLPERFLPHACIYVVLIKPGAPALGEAGKGFIVSTSVLGGQCVIGT